MEEILKSYTVILGPINKFKIYMKNNKFSIGEILNPEVGSSYNFLMLLALLQCNLNPDCPNYQLQDDTGSDNWRKLHNALKRVESSIMENLEIDEEFQDYEFFVLSSDTKLPEDGKNSECQGWLVQVLFGYEES